MTDIDEIRELLDNSRRLDSNFKETLIQRTTDLVEKLLYESIKSTLREGGVRHLVFGLELYGLDREEHHLDPYSRNKDKLDLTGLFCEIFNMERGRNVGVIKYHSIHKILEDALLKLNAKYSITISWFESDCQKFTLSQRVYSEGDWMDDEVIILPESIKIKHDFFPFSLHYLSTPRGVTKSFQRLGGIFSTTTDYGEPKKVMDDGGYIYDSDGDPYSYACGAIAGIENCPHQPCYSKCRLGFPMIIAVVQFP